MERSRFQTRKPVQFRIDHGAFSFSPERCRSGYRLINGTTTAVELGRAVELCHPEHVTLADAAESGLELHPGSDAGHLLSEDPLSAESYGEQLQSGIDLSLRSERRMRRRLAIGSTHAVSTPV